MQAFSVTVGVHHDGEEHQPRDVPTLDCSSTVSEKNASPVSLLPAVVLKKIVHSAHNP
jgi:hypothetical protein